MRFTQDLTPGVNVVRSYAAGEFRIGDRLIKGGVIVSAGEILVEPQMRVVEDLAEAHAKRVLSLQPEVVLLGTGARQVFPAPAFAAHFLRAGIGFEVMDSGAACRTFNVLVAERRRAVAVLLP
ncbi:MAG TPA: MTH938/NDUFAF3 family protein [Steroidobacteraceae bacterium]|nr:MTH938/NDUFAF3 family protein [Steroidobacteraceae bacterium]